MFATTVDVTDWKKPNEVALTATQVRLVLGIKTRDTWLLCKHAANLERKGNFFTRSDIVEILKVRLFIAARPGENSYDGYIAHRNQPALLAAKFRIWDVDFDSRVNQMNQKIDQLLKETQ